MRCSSWTLPTSSPRWPTGRSASCPTLRGRTVVNLFFEDSTRTRISFEAAAKRLSADVINFSAKGSSVAKGESLKDTALTLEAMGADAVVIRHPRVRRAAPAGGLGPRQRGQRRRRRARASDAGAAGRVHDARGGWAGWTGLRVTIVGDVLHSRVARSNVLLLQHARRRGHAGGAADAAAGRRVRAGPARSSYDLTAVLPKTDVVMMLRVQQERMNAAYFPSVREYSTALRPGRQRGWRCCPSTPS